MAQKEIHAAFARKKHAVSKDWLGRLHDSYVQRFLSDNERIWSTAGILVPVSFASVPAYFAVDNFTLPIAIAFGVVSLMVIGFWFLIADAHRRFQERSLAVANAIEQYILGPKRMKRVRRAVESNLPRRTPSVRGVRIALVLGLLVVWVAISTLTGLGTFHSLAPSVSP